MQCTESISVTTNLSSYTSKAVHRFITRTKKERNKVRSMEQLEKVEKLRKRAGVSYEEAKEALEANNWDLLDAMVYLEKQGKIPAPEQESYSTHTEEEKQMFSVEEVIKQNQYEEEESFGKKMARFFKKLWKIGNENNFIVKKREKEIINVPVWIFVVVLLFAWQVVLPVMLIALFFNCHFFFRGKNNLGKANEAMEKASAFADKVKDEYEKL